MPTGHKMWSRQTWQYPRVHDWLFGFGLDADDVAATKNSTIVPYFWQDNAIIDYEDIKTNPENADFAVQANGNCAAGSYIPKCTVNWLAWNPSAVNDLLTFKYLPINVSMLNRLDAFDKKTGNDIETILELTHETTDEQAFPLYNTVKLYEGHQVVDYPAGNDGLTGTQQPEGVAFDMELYFDALHYYTNKEMLRQVTGRMESYNLQKLSAASGGVKERVKSFYRNVVPSMCKFQHPYTACMGLFTCPQAGTMYQPSTTAEQTAVETLTVAGRVRFNEYNPDWNFARA